MRLILKQRRRLVLIIGSLYSVSAYAEDKAVEPALTVRAVGPDRQAAAVLKLFEGAKATSPAAAMAGWRRAAREPNGLPKAVQAVAAAFNPEMVAEWRAFRDTVLTAGLDPEGLPHWSAVAPHDDGALAAMVTSMRLSGGGDEPPLGSSRVERLGGEGSALAAVTTRGTAFASTRDDLAAALARLSRSQVDAMADLLPLRPEDSGFRFVFDPACLPAEFPASVIQARAVAGARAAGLEAMAGFLSLRDDHLDLDLASRFSAESPSLLDTPAVDPAWLSWMPADATLAAATLATGPGPAFWDALFQVADRVDRADPVRSQLQPLRVRLNLTAALRGVRLEADLWPLLRGASGGVLGEPTRSGNVSGAILTLHTDRPEDADRILKRVVQPSIAGAARVGGKPVEAIARGTTVVVAWGEGALATALKSAELPDRSAATIIGRDDRPIGRAAFFRPILVDFSRFDGADSPLTRTFAEAAPVVWRGGWAGGRAWDVVRWGDLRRSVARFLDRVPQAPAEAP